MQACPAPSGLAPIQKVVLDRLEPSIDWVPVFTEDRAGAFAAGTQDYEPGFRDQDSVLRKN